MIRTPIQTRILGLVITVLSPLPLLGATVASAQSWDEAAVV